MDKNIIATDGNLFFSLSEFNKVKLLDIRKFYKDKETKEFKPTSKGISVTKKSYETIKRILSQNDEQIKNWLDDETGVDITITQRQKSLEEQLFTFTPVASKHEKWKSPEFFDSTPECGINTITYNERHAFYEKITSIRNELENVNPEKAKEFSYLINAIISSFTQAKNLLDDKNTDKDLINVLIYNWGIILQNALKRD